MWQWEMCNGDKSQEDVDFIFVNIIWDVQTLKVTSLDWLQVETELLIADGVNGD